MLMIFSVYDSKAEAYLQPFFCTNRAVAIRNFGSAVVDQKSLFFAHPEDYSLFELGSFSEHTGELVQAKNLSPLGCASDFLKSEG